ncbi:hypothetical protein BSPLISOX_1687 [uncultured Gammaproteobacteria bacterium]|jgi:hypothetical protein|nr:hypothetical protein BSPLISOX_1687 [uncultured Gammaproteobacteria bacterium]
MITRNEFIVLIVSFILGLFLTHPLGFSCDESCIHAVTFLSCAFAFLNMEIYTFFTGGSVWNPIAWGAATKSLVEDNSNKNKLIRKISFIFILIIDILIIYGIYKQSWIFN